MNKFILRYLLLSILVIQRSFGQSIQAPTCEVKAKVLEKYGIKRVDNYYWLNQRDNPEVKAHLEAENKYTFSVAEQWKTLQDKLYQELKTRVSETDISAPFLSNGYYYYNRFETGNEYTIICRRPNNSNAPEEILLNVNELAKGYKYYQVGSYTTSDDNKILAYMVDTSGRREYILKFKDLEKNTILPFEIPNVSSFCWAGDNKSIFFATLEPQTLRPDKIYRYGLGQEVKSASLVYHEKDKAFDAYVYRSKSQKYVFIYSYSPTVSEFQYLDAKDSDGKFKIFYKREAKHFYNIDHYGDQFYIITNWEALNFRLMTSTLETHQKTDWKELIPHRSDVLLEGIEIFKDYLAVEERKEGLTQLQILSKKDNSTHYINFGEAVYDAYIGANLEVDTDTLRFIFSSLTSPVSVYNYNMKSKLKVLLKQEKVEGDFDQNNYESKRIYANSSDGTKIPMSLAYKKTTKLDGQSPCLLTGYGAYGIAADIYFDRSLLSLLDRGFVFAIAHVRGGNEMGQIWYDQGKLFEKKNTFTDFISCSEYLVSQKITVSEKLFIKGVSAGGLLMGAVTNMRPDLYKGVIASVPFVDIVTSMLDESLPLTTGEYTEWGNPNKKETFEYMLSYSPYDNLEKKPYPNILMTTGFYDSQVQYFEPAKYVAKLRTLKTDSNLLLLKTDLDAGHSGKVGRFTILEDTAFEYAFILYLLGLN